MDLAKLGPLVLRVQAPVLAQYGLPPSPAGIELMKFAIHRRIAEGAAQLQPLANEARRVLGLQPLPKLRQQRAEEMLAEMAAGREQAPTRDDLQVGACSQPAAACSLLAAAGCV